MKNKNTVSSVPYLFGTLFIFFLSLVHACAPVRIGPPSQPIDPQQISQYLSLIQEQEDVVHAFFCSGRLHMKGEGPYTEAQALFAGTKEPFRLKAEITHSWGRPLFYALIREGTIRILSFAEKRLYLGRVSSAELSRFFPGQFDPKLVWTLARGYPILLEHARAISKRSDQIMLLDAQGKTVQVIDYNPRNPHPQRVTLVERGMEVSFSEFVQESGFSYALQVRVNDVKENRGLGFDLNKIVFNRPIPQDLFTIEHPPGFTLFPL